MSKREASSRIDEAASLWATRLDGAGLDDQERAEFDAWLAGDTRRVGAFARAQAVLHHVKRAKALGPDFDPAAFPAFAVAADERVDPVDPAASEPVAVPASPARRRLLVAASAIAATGLFAFLPVTRAAARTYTTGRGEIRVVPLEDGSTVTLNTDSSIVATIDGTSRSVRLLAGEALFKVAPAARAAFVVDAGDASLRARGATFAVCRLAAQPLRVTVCAGDIEVERDGASAPRRSLLRANMEAAIPAGGATVERRVTPDALRRELAWQEGMLAFEDTPLGQAAEQFARYSDRRILIADADVGAETVTGLYSANNPDGFALAVALSLNLHMQSTASGIILVR